MSRAWRVIAAASVTALLVDIGVAYWWLSFGPFPESAWPS